MPAAAVIPAPIAYTNVVAVRKLVVGFLASVRLARGPGVLVSRFCASAILRESVSALDWVGGRILTVYFEKIRVFKAGLLCCEYN